VLVLSATVFAFAGFAGQGGARLPGRSLPAAAGKRRPVLVIELEAFKPDYDHEHEARARRACDRSRNQVCAG
jgi:hypothetical protein